MYPNADQFNAALDAIRRQRNTMVAPPLETTNLSGMRYLSTGDTLVELPGFPAILTGFGDPLQYNSPPGSYDKTFLYSWVEADNLVSAGTSALNLAPKPNGQSGTVDNNPAIEINLTKNIPPGTPVYITPIFISKLNRFLNVFQYCCPVPSSRPLVDSAVGCDGAKISFPIFPFPETVYGPGIASFGADPDPMPAIAYTTPWGESGTFRFKVGDNIGGLYIHPVRLACQLTILSGPTISPTPDGIGDWVSQLAGSFTARAFGQSGYYYSQTIGSAPLGPIQVHVFISNPPAYGFPGGINGSLQILGPYGGGPPANFIVWNGLPSIMHYEDVFYPPDFLIDPHTYNGTVNITAWSFWPMSATYICTVNSAPSAFTNQPALYHSAGSIFQLDVTGLYY